MRLEYCARIVEVEIDDPGATVRDLLVVLRTAVPEPPSASGDAGSATGVAIDGTPVTVDTPLSAVTLCEGSTVEVGASAATPRWQTPAPGRRTLAVVGGIHSGPRIVVDGAVTVGRNRTADLVVTDPTLSAEHVVITDRSVGDLDSRNGTSIEGHPVVGTAPLRDLDTVRAGTTRLALRSTVDDRPAAVVAGLGRRGGLIPFNRPPRPDPPTAEPTLVVPGPAPSPPPKEPLSVAGIVLPILAGAIVALLFSPFMAVFAALGPVVTVGMWWERRRRGWRQHRVERDAFDTALEEVDAFLPTARAIEVQRRRRLHPDPAEVVRRAHGPSARCWERRTDHPDAFRVAIGAADDPFRPVLVAAGEATEPADEIVARVEAQPPMPDVPVEIDLSPGHVVGLLGDRAGARAVARCLLLQMATHHGPADLCVAVAADEMEDWHWCGWLPHTADRVGGRPGASLIPTGDSAGAGRWIDTCEDRAHLAIITGANPFEGRTTAGRRWLADPRTAAVVLVDDPHRLPVGCDTIITVDPLGRVTVVDPRQAGPGRVALGWGVSASVARTAARRLARLDDPELPVVGAGVPTTAPLPALLGVDGEHPEEITSRWSATEGTAELVVPIGLSADGPLALDLVRDGPHVLLGGTTGSGKSELLRSLVAGVAATADVDHAALVLIDYKGGAAFDRCADLPHVAGVVTDLDPHLSARALRCLEAELRHREQRLRAVGAEDLAEFRARAPRGAEPLPRLLVVVDEFASLAADLPEFLAALLGIAQRGRSLGVHMILATQRPAGVVTDDIRANTACRIALRVTDRNDSIDVLDAPDAASIPRSRPGRAVARFGPGELIPFQSALSTGRSERESGVALRTEDRPVRAGPTDLDRLVAVIGAAHRARGTRAPRAPWPPELPADLHVDDLGPDPGHWLLADDPDEQRQFPAGWSVADGHLVVCGSPGSGATTTLVGAALASARADGALHLHGVDLDGGQLGALAAHPAAGTIADPADANRRSRLVRWLDDEVHRRKSSGVPHCRLLVLIDDFGGLHRAHDPVREAAFHERIARIWADGPAVGVTFAVTVRRAADLPPALVATVGEVLLHRTDDESDGLRVSMKHATRHFGPGRAVQRTSGLVVQVARAGDSSADAVEHHLPAPSPPLLPHEVGELGTDIGWSVIPARVEVGSAGATIEIAVRERDLLAAGLVLHRGEHAMVLGPPRSGRTNALAAIARAAPDRVVVVGDGDLARLVPDRATPTSSALEVAHSVVLARGGCLVLVDDCLGVDDPDGVLRHLAETPPPGMHLVAAARPDRYRAAFGHWAADLRSSRIGLLLRPDPLDGDLLGQPLPARLERTPTPGRGLAVADGSCEVVQVIRAVDPEEPPLQPSAS